MPPLMLCLLLIASCTAQPGGLSMAYGDVRDSKYGDVGLAVLSYELPVLALSERWQLRYVADAGALFARHADDSRGAILSAGPLLHYRTRLANLTVGIDFASRPAWISEAEFNMRSLGSHFHFLSHIGVTVEAAGSPVYAGFRYQHLSNAGLREINPGMDMAVFSLGLRVGAGP